MLKSLKKQLGFQVSHVKNGKRFNSKKCVVCKEIIGQEKFSFHNGKHYHKKCLREVYKNE